MKIVINPKYKKLGSFIKNLPYEFENSGETIYSARNIIKRFIIDDIDLTVKRYKVPLRINQLVYTFFRPSKAERAYKYALYLLKCGIRTPEPIAYIEVKRGHIFYQGYFISLTENYPRLMREFNDGIHDQENILNAFADFTVKLHEAGILHLDYSPGNILFKIDQDKISFSLVDLNRMHFGKLTPKQCLRNFERLTWDPNVIRYIVTEYAKKRGWDIDKSVKAAQHFQAEFFRKWAKKMELKKRIRRK